VGEDRALLAESRVLFVRRCSSEHRDRVVFLRGNRAHLAKDGAHLAEYRALLKAYRAVLAKSRVLWNACSSLMARERVLLEVRRSLFGIVWGCFGNI